MSEDAAKLMGAETAEGRAVAFRGGRVLYLPPNVKRAQRAGDFQGVFSEEAREVGQAVDDPERRSR